MRGPDTVVLPYYQTETAPWKRGRKLPEWTKEPIKITFNLDFMDGEFKIADYDIKSYREIEDGEKIQSRKYKFCLLF